MSRPLRRWLPALAASTILVGMLLVGTARAATHEVEITGFAFAPEELTIAVGDTVTWTNLDPVVHTATGTGGAFDSGDLAQGDSYSVTFTAPGTFDYLCTPHPEMTGRIIVVAAMATPAPTAGSLPDVALSPPRGDAGALGAGLLVLVVLALVATRRLLRS